MGASGWASGQPKTPCNSTHGAGQVDANWAMVSRSNDAASSTL
jgi:hypothetical protein